MADENISDWSIQSVRTSEAWQEVLELSDATKSWMINFYSKYYIII